MCQGLRVSPSFSSPGLNMHSAAVFLASFLGNLLMAQSYAMEDAENRVAHIHSPQIMVHYMSGARL